MDKETYWARFLWLTTLADKTNLGVGSIHWDSLVSVLEIVDAEFGGVYPDHLIYSVGVIALKVKETDRFCAYTGYDPGCTFSPELRCAEFAKEIEMCKGERERTMAAFASWLSALESSLCQQPCDRGGNRVYPTQQQFVPLLGKGVGRVLLIVAQRENRTNVLRLYQEHPELNRC